ncbi:MAG: homoserine dehydrogenase [candidate division NC10 bacterium]|nr:homoserine dehydrogenase [candidate division NC10 bacterium]
MKIINVGILGLGTIGSGVVKVLQGHQALLDRRVGARLRIRRIAEVGTPRIEVDPKLLTRDAREVIDDPQIDIVVELIGGTTVAKTLCLEAVNKGKHLVTANKALLAEQGLEIYQAAATKRVDLGFEASVCGAIPIIRSVREGLVANQVRSIMGIVNGTTNYILTKMTESGQAFATVLAEAQAKGYAEADPTLDVGGFDAAHKLQILGSLAYGSYIRYSDIHIEGIQKVEAVDIEFARELGCRIKLLAIAKEEQGELEVRVHPTMIPDSHLLASVGGVYNAVHIRGDSAGSLMFSGRGAGQMPTASSVVADIVEIAHNIIFHRPSRASLLPTTLMADEGIRIRPIERIRGRYYLRIMAVDKPGVLSKVSGVLGEYNISIASMIQKGRAEQAAVPIVMLTHEANEGDVQKALKRINHLEVVAQDVVLFRMEGIED